MLTSSSSSSRRDELHQSMLENSLALTQNASLSTRPTKHTATNRSRSLIATSWISGTSKRPYLTDFETFRGYFRWSNLLVKFFAIVMDPCNRALQDIMLELNELQERDEEITAEEIPEFETKWAEHWPHTRGTIIAGCYKILTVDVIKKCYDYLALALLDTRTTDRLTKLVEKSCLRKLERHGDGVTNRAFVAIQLFRTTAYALLISKLSLFTYEVLDANWTLYKAMGRNTKKFLKPSKALVQDVSKFMIKNSAYFMTQYLFQIVTVSLGCAFDYMESISGGWISGLGSVVGHAIGEGMADQVCKVVSSASEQSEDDDCRSASPIRGRG